MTVATHQAAAPVGTTAEQAAAAIELVGVAKQYTSAEENVQAVERVDLSERPFRAWARGVEYRADSVIVATGASALWLGLPSEERLRGRGAGGQNDKGRNEKTLH